MGSPHDRLGVVLETAMIALMHDASSVVLGFVPPIPSSRPHAGQPYIAWKQANSSVLRREVAGSVSDTHPVHLIAGLPQPLGGLHPGPESLPSIFMS